MSVCLTLACYIALPPMFFYLLFLFLELKNKTSFTVDAEVEPQDIVP